MLCVVACCCVLLRLVGSCWMKFETGQTSEPTSANISIVSRSSKRGPTMLRSFAQLRGRTRTTNKEFNMASEMENVNEELIEELTATKGRKKAAIDGKDRRRARRWTEPEIDDRSSWGKILLVGCQQKGLPSARQTRKSFRRDERHSGHWRCWNQGQDY